MTIQNVSPEPARPTRTGTGTDAKSAPAPSVVSPRPEDRVELSSEALTQAPAEGAEGMSQARIASLRAWIASGGYKDDSIRTEVAKRMLQLSDV